MKKVLLLTAAIISFATLAIAQEVTLEWDPVVANISGYRVYARTGAEYGPDPIWDGLNTTCKVQASDEEDTAFIVRSYREGEITGITVESANSNEVAVPGKRPQAPNNLIIKAIDQIIQSLIDIKNAIGGA